MKCTTKNNYVTEQLTRWTWDFTFTRETLCLDRDQEEGILVVMQD